MVFCDFFGVTEVFLRILGGFSVRVRRVTVGSEGFRGDGGSRARFWPRRARETAPPASAAAAGSSSGVEAGFLRQWPGCRVRLEFQRGHNGGRAEFSVGLGHDGRLRRTLKAVCSWPTRTARPRRSHRPRPERRLEGAPLTEPDGIRSGSPDRSPGRGSAMVRGRV